jgi:CRISPR/Cas system CMR-associated protein Cmr5 small subunit
MKNKKLLIIGLIIVLIIIFFSVKINEVDNNNYESNTAEILSPNENKSLENATEYNMKLEDVILPNGEKTLDFLCEHDRNSLSKEEIIKCKNK